MAAKIVIPGTQEVVVPTTPGEIDRIESIVIQSGGQIQDFGEELERLPLEHKFTPGMYIRQILMPAETLVTTKIHKTEHPYVISVGTLAVKIEGDRWRGIAAPHHGITYPGTRRVLYTFTDTVWTTFHVNPDDCQDIAEIERRLAVHPKNSLLKEVAA